jgi:hypothetical protein
MKKLNDDPPMNPDDFEKHLQSQPMRPAPAQWRSEILAAATSASQESSKPGDNPSPASTFQQRLTALLWPCPQAWAGLAAVWMVILTIQFCNQPSQSLAQKISPPSPEMAQALKEQQQMLAQLIAPFAQPAAEPKPFKTGPRSDVLPGVTIL